MNLGGRTWRALALVMLAAVATVCGLLLAELTVRTYLPGWAPRTARMTAFWQYDARYGWSHVPNVSARFKTPGFDVDVRINSRGFRGRETSYSRGGRGRRAVVLGDSHVWGFGVEEERTFCSLLEKLIPDLEVVNLGVSGYSTDQELLLYQDEAHRYAADVVVLVVAHNDLRGNTRTIESAVYGKPRFLLDDGGLVLDNYPVPPPVWYKRLAFELSARSYLLTRALRVVDQLRRDADASLGPVPREEQTREERERLRSQPFPWTPAHDTLARLLLEFDKQVSAQEPAPHLFVVFADLRNGLGAEVVEYLRRFDVPAVALDSEIPPADLAWHLPDGLHWTEAGHRRVAEILAEHLHPLLADAVPGSTAGSSGR